MESQHDDEVGSRVDRSLMVRHFYNLPSPDHFASHIEPANVPAVFHGVAKDWKAVSRWNPCHGGLDYLQVRVGAVTVEAMTSKSGSVFYGDIRSHERVPIPFSTFITLCKCHLQNSGTDSSSSFAREESTSEEVSLRDLCLASSDISGRLYLAQVPILNKEGNETCPMENLIEDIETPCFLLKKILASINLWMNSSQSRSSSHYDPHNNLLCVVSGCKQVCLWPPSACPMLYPMSVYGEASNHSAVSIENIDTAKYPRAENYKEYSQKITLHSGDALFIPEGWFHQVDSDVLTIAVNFWWRSEIMSGMLEHMDGYYLRRIINRLMEKEMNQMLQEGSVTGFSSSKNTKLQVEGSEGNSGFVHNHIGKHSEEIGSDTDILQKLTPNELRVLYEIVALVHDAVNTSKQTEGSESCITKQSAVDNSLCAGYSSLVLEKNPVSSTISSLEPLKLRNILLGMASHFPRSLEFLILHMLSPMGAEVLTRKFDEMDQLTTKEEQEQFYQLFYSTFEDQYAAMDAILNGKELFAFQALKNVLDQYLGVDVTKPSG